MLLHYVMQHKVSLHCISGFVNMALDASSVTSKPEFQQIRVSITGWIRLSSCRKHWTCPPWRRWACCEDGWAQSCWVSAEASGFGQRPSLPPAGGGPTVEGHAAHGEGTWVCYTKKTLLQKQQTEQDNHQVIFMLFLSVIQYGMKGLASDVG